MKVTYWSDYACPYCYIGVVRLEKAIESLGMGGQVQIEMKAFELNPDAPREAVGTTVDRFAAKYGISTEAAAKRIEGICKAGCDEGIDFNYATTLYTNMLDAHRITKLAHDLGNTRFEKLCYHAYFAENQVMANHDVLRRIAAEAGLPREDVDRVLASREYEAQVRADEGEAFGMGVYSVPFFMIDDQHKIRGCVPVSEMARVLKQACGEDGDQADATRGWGVKTNPCGTVW